MRPIISRGLARLILSVLIISVVVSIGWNIVQAQSSIRLGTRGINVLSNLILWADRSPEAYSVKEAKRLRQLGVEFIRLPVDPVGLMHSNGSFAPEKLNNLDTAIRHFTGAGLRVIVDMHSFSPFPGTQRDFTRHVVCGGQALDTYTQFLTPLARHLHQFDHRLVALELLNEPYNPQYKDDPCKLNGQVQDDIHWLKTLDRLRQAARAGSKTLTLVLSGEDWGNTASLQALPRLNDANIIYSLHYYERLAFTHQGASWLQGYYKALEQVPYPLQNRSLNSIWPKIAANIDANPEIQDKAAAKQAGRKTLDCYYGMPNSGCQPYGREDMVTTFAQARQQAKRLGVAPSRLLLGEFGVLSGIEDPKTDRFRATATLADRVAWLRDVRTTAETNGIAHAMWLYNDHMGFGVYRADQPKQLEGQILRALGLKMPS